MSAKERALLCALAAGATLKVHRDLDGGKAPCLHPLDGLTQPVTRGLVQSLQQRGLIDSNMKFPAATYLLTEKGRRAAANLVDDDSLPLSSRSYSG